MWKPSLNVDDKAKDELTIKLDELDWTEFVPVNWGEWKKDLEFQELWKWHKARNDKVIMIDDILGNNVEGIDFHE